MLRLLCLFISCLFFCCRNENIVIPEKEEATTALPLITHSGNKATGTDGPLQTDSSVLSKNISKVLKRARAGNFSTTYALLADLGLHSGSRRLYLINLADKKLIQTALVAHGSSTSYLPNGQRRYSNVEGSLCSSLGMYKIGGAYQGSFGLAYKLFGLDSGNSNAYARAVVLHSYSCVPDEETEDPICQSWGCPMVSPAFLQTLGSYIKESPKPMLLYIFDSSEKK